MITVVGSSNTDFSIKVDRFPVEGETILGDDIFISGGGKGANQASCAAKLGGEVNFIANIGMDYFGRLSVKNLRNAGINTKFVKMDKSRDSGAAFILVDRRGRNMITVSPGSNMNLSPADIIRRSGCIRKSRVVLLQMEVPLEAVKAALCLAKRFNRITVLNPAPARAFSGALLSKVDFLIPNECELSMLTGNNSTNTPVESARLLLKRGAGCVIITLGKKGALLVNENRVKLFRAKKVRVVDTTCAGDAFCGAFALGLDKGRSVEDSIEFANCAAALTVSKPGAQCSLPTFKEVNKHFL